ncbi:MAG: radical SAM protein, partial [Proteobacteria bacterium]|nr:radical SAM protein [Pseudomonadota bacterium]
MKAQIKPRIDLLNRTKLETVIPLTVPFIINVDPSDACNFQCKFCPTGDRKLMKKTPGRNHGIMDFELYKKIIDDICEFDKPIKVLRLYKDGEPLLNPRLAEMIRYA